MFKRSRHAGLAPRPHSGFSGFTVIEVSIVLAIWSVIVAVVLFDYTRVSSREELKSAAGELALAFREAQTWGTSARAFPSGSTDSDRFDRGFGVFVQKGSGTYITYGGAGTNGSNSTHNRFNSSNTVLERELPGHVIVKSICVADSGMPDDCVTDNTDELSVLFRRPFFHAIILDEYSTQKRLFAKITLTVSRNPELTRTVIIWSTGRFYTGN